MPWSSSGRVCALIFVLSTAAGLAAQVPAYGREVRPILAENCFRCHGPDASGRKADLRLDRPGQVRGDEVIRRITATDPDELMPPSHTDKKLTASQIEILRRWVEAGTPYEKHWSFVPPQRPELPESGGESAHPIDRFIRARLEQVRLQPSPEADRATLVRRVYLDLIGLPPTPKQVDAFLQDREAGAYARLVDSLLASPHYGERWARRWLDLARYADTNGYEKDRPRSIWPYRDWVIRAFNDDMPFDEFAVQQLAGDMLPEPTPAQRIATGFHRNSMLNEEGGIDPLEFRYYAVQDRVATTGTVFLGLTMGCAQCHTHKYDPITHREYYGMMAYFNNADEPDYVIPNSEAEARNAQNREKAAELLERAWTEWPAESEPREQRFAGWLADAKSRAHDWHTVRPRVATSNTLSLAVESDGAVFARGDTTKHDIYRLEFSAQEQPITAVRLEALPDDRLPNSGPGLTYYEGNKGDFFLSEVRLRAGSGDAVRAVEIGRATESYAKNQYSNQPVRAELTTDGDYQTGWSAHMRNGERHVALFELAEPIPQGMPFALEMHFGRHFASSLGRFRWSVTGAAKPGDALGLPFDNDGSAEALLRRPEDQWSAADRTRLRHAFLLTATEVEKAGAEARKLLERRERDRTLVLSERPAGLERVTRRHHRGEFLQPREVVEPHVPEVFGCATQPKTRLQFAHWLVSAENPLMARVVVNRHWAALFGRGIVATVDDFGVQGDAPTHPRLLDWLAVEFVESGWSLKHLHRLLVTSATYRQSSVVRPEHLARDPSNAWLARSPRPRLEAEVLRDAALVATGKLVSELFGPPVKPVQPAGVTEVAFGRRKWQPSEGDGRYRRSLYTFQKRTAPFAFHMTFDAPSGEECIARRQRSTTPLQALALLNDPMMLDLAQAFGAEVAGLEAGAEFDTAGALRAAFRRVLSREPTEVERQSLTRFLARQKERGDSEVAWTALVRALLCLDEAQTRN